MSLIDAHCTNLNSSSYCWDSQWALAGYCNLAACVFALSQILTRSALANKQSTKIMLQGAKPTTKLGRTRLVAELLTVSFLFRAVWFFLKGLPGEPWACPGKVTFGNKSNYGDAMCVFMRAQ